jgi:hypothetical protein
MKGGLKSEIVSQSEIESINKKNKIRYNIRIGYNKLRKIKISVNEIKGENNLYQRKLDYDDFLELDNFFALYHNLDEILIELDELITQNQIILTLDENDPKKLYFEFDAEVNNNLRRISITLFKKYNEHMDAINNICKALVVQNNLIDKMTSENNELKKKIEQLDSRVAEKEEEKILMENESIKGTKEIEDYDKASELIRKDLKIEERNEQYTFISPKNLNEIQPCKPEEIMKNTKIMNHIKEFNFLIKKINKNISYTSKQFYNMKLIYRATDDGDKAEIFHQKCDNISPILIMIKTDQHRRFGGFTQTFFESTEKPVGKLDGSAFIFSLDKLKSYDVQEGQNPICTCKDKGPIFYGNECSNIYLSDNFFSKKGNVARKGDRFNTNEDYEINFGKPRFLTREIEAYQIYLTKLN